MNLVDRVRLLALASALLLGACATSPPAPVESRTSPPPARTARPAPAPAPAPVPVKPAAEPDAVQTAPVRPSGIQTRPLESADDRRGAAGQLRTQPKGVKRPYTESALAEMRAADAKSTAPPAAGAAAAAVPGPSGASPTPAVPAAPAAPAKPPETAARPEARAEAKPEAKEEAKAAAAGPEFSWPAKGKVLQGYSEPRSTGISIAGNIGDPVSAAADGKVIFSGQGPRGYGNLVIVKHDADTLSVYGHNKSVLVKEGQAVKRGQKIAELGDSGTDNPKLHFEIRKNGRPVDPQKLLPPR
jgi:lipoprotein NlpD